MMTGKKYFVPKNTVRRIFVEAGKEEGVDRIAKDALEYATEKFNEALKRLAYLTIQITKNQSRKTVQKRDVSVIVENFLSSLTFNKQNTL